MRNTGRRGPHSSEAGTVASNGEIVPEESASAESIRKQADEHPASDSHALSDQVQSRQGDEPTGLTRESETPDAGSGPARGQQSAGHVAAATAEERAVVAAGGEPVATSVDDRPEYEGPNSL